MSERKLNASGWCCLSAFRCKSPVGCPTVSGGRGGELCRSCASDPADLALFEEAEKATVYTDPDTGKPLVEFVKHSDDFSRVEGFAQIYDARGTATLYRVEQSAGPDGGLNFCLIKLREDAGDREARAYRCTVTTGGYPHECDCRGFLRYGTACKHLRALGRLVHERELC
jgi:hypothetical protein